MIETPTRTHEFKVAADTLVDTFKELVHEGNVRRIVVKDEDGNILVEFPLTAGVVTAIVLPQLAAVAAIAALMSHFTLYVEREEEPSEPKS